MMRQVSTLFLSLALLLSVGTSHASLASNKAFVPKVKQHAEILKNQNVLELRGGAGPLDPMKTAKFTVALIIAQGALMKEAPSFNLEQYGLKSNPSRDFLMKMFGIGIFSLALMFYCLLYQDTSLTTAFQIGLIPWILENVGGYLNKSMSAIGYDDGGSVFSIVLMSFMMYAATQDYADTAIMIYAGAWLVYGIYEIVNPAGASKLWGDAKLDDTSLMQIRFVGFYLAASCIALLAMTKFDQDALTAFGYTELVWVALHVVTLLNGDVDKSGMPKGPMYAWMALHVVVAATILIEGGGGAPAVTV